MGNILIGIQHFFVVIITAVTVILPFHKPPVQPTPSPSPIIQAKQEATPFPSPTLTPSPTPTIQKVTTPSKEALKTAAFLWMYISDTNKSQIKSKLGGGDDNSTIRNWAIEMDNDPVIFARNEAEIEKVQQQKASKPVYIPYVQQQPHSCITTGSGYSAYTTCY